MVFPGDAPRAVEVMTAAAAAASSSSPSPPAHRSLVLRGKPRSRHPISPLRAAWANQRLLRCVRVDADDSMAAPVPSPPVPSSERRPAGAADDGFERIRAKLMDHLREAVGRIELPVVPPGEPKRNHLVVQPAEEADVGNGDDGGQGVSLISALSPSPAAVPVATAAAAAASAVEELPWNLRTRKPGASCNGRQPNQHQHNVPSSLSPSPAPSPPAKPASRLRSGAPDRREGALRRRRPRFSVPLTKDEIDEDLYAFTGRRASRRPKKRSRVVQKQLDMLFPGLWLSEVTAEIYQVADPPPPASSPQKR